MSLLDQNITKYILAFRGQWFEEAFLINENEEKIGIISSPPNGKQNSLKEINDLEILTTNKKFWALADTYEIKDT